MEALIAFISFEVPDMELFTERLILRPFQETDLDDLYEFLSQLENDEFEGYPGITRESCLEHLKQRVGSEEFYAILEKEYNTEGRLHMIETERLLLREYTPDDFDALYEILSDPETMRHYPAPYDEAGTRHWIEWNLENYTQYGFGLWAVVLKETGEFIGDCGITIQNIDGEMLPEIGYHIHKKYWRRGFAKEAARAVRNWAFQNTEYNVLYSYMKHTNEGSWRTAMANGMKKVKEYPDPKNTISYAFAITREEWENLKRKNADIV